MTPACSPLEGVSAMPVVGTQQSPIRIVNAYECHRLPSLPGDTKARGPKLVIAVFFNSPPRKQGGPGRKLAPLKSLARSWLPELNRRPREYVPGGNAPPACEAEHATPINPLHFLP